MFKRKPRIMRDKPPPGNQYLARWYSHVQKVGEELANAAAPPPWGMRLARAVRGAVVTMWREAADYWSAPMQQIVTRPPNPPRHEATCAHAAARTTTLGAAITKPKPADARLMNVDALVCPDCGMTVAVLR